VWTALDNARVTPKRWRYIVIHHSASVQGDPAGIDRYHRERRHMENGLAYHFVIGNGRGMPDGQIAIGNRWALQLNGGHLASEDLNRISIGICLIGNFDNGQPTKRQMESLRALVLHLMARCRLPASSVRTHRQINTKPTECPGAHFPTKKFIASLQAR
jgi:N-acetyl-anhydromuramyl-L-alanine amidase AmpD